MIEMLKDLCYHPGSSSGEAFQKEKRLGQVWIPKQNPSSKTDPPTLSFGEKGGFFLSGPLDTYHVRPVNILSLGMHRSMRRVVGLPPGVDFFNKKNDRCWYMESKYLKHPKKQENISKIRT